MSRLRWRLWWHVHAVQKGLWLLACTDAQPAWVVRGLLLPLERGLCWLACRVGPKG